MAPQTNIPLAANILGTIGTILWCVQLVPQIWHNWKHKTTEGLPALMMLLWAIGMYEGFDFEIHVPPPLFFLPRERKGRKEEMKKRNASRKLGIANLGLMI